MEQRSVEWFAARLGKVTASKVNDVLATLKNGGEAAGRKNYRAQLVVERLTGEKTDSFTNGAMQWGVDNEDSARMSYEFLTGCTVDQVGFIDHPTIPMSGASPDGFIGEDGLLEIKCPNTANHIDYLLAGVVPSEYQNQMLWQMECTGRKWCDFVSYDPRMPIEGQLFVIRFERDDSRIDTIRAEVVKFLAEVDSTLNQLRTKLNI